MNNKFIINFQPGDTVLHKLTGATKVRLFVVLTVYLIMSWDLRLILPVAVAGVVGLFSLKPNWKPIKFMFAFIVILNLFNLFLFYIADPDIGTKFCASKTVLAQFTDYFYVSGETLWYLFTRFIKIIASFMVSIVFILSITPSEFAAGLYSIKVPYKICTVVELAYRCIPDIVRDYQNISTSMQARGVEMDKKKTKLFARLKQAVLIIVPLLFSSFDKVGNIANAMDLRGYGKLKKRSYYAEHEMTKADKVFKVVYIVGLLICIAYIAYKMFSPNYLQLWYPFV